MAPGGWAFLSGAMRICCTRTDAASRGGSVVTCEGAHAISWAKRIAGAHGSRHLITDADARNQTAPAEAASPPPPIPVCAS